MKKILIAIVITPLIYLLIALALVLIPVQRDKATDGLDFDVLDFVKVSATDFLEERYTARDNNELFYRHFHGNSDLTMVLLHGSGSEGRYLIPLARKLNSTLDVDVVIPDLRGHGRSALVNLGDIAYLGQFEHDLSDLYEHLIAHNPDAKIILGGHSSGGGLAVKIAGSNAKFDGFLLLAPYLGYQAPTVRRNSGGWVQVAQLRYAGLAMLNNIGVTFLNGMQVLFFNRPSELNGKLQADSYTYRLNESLSPQTYSADLQNTKKPMLVLVGRDDEAFYAEIYREVLQQYAPHAELYLIPEVKHLNLPNSQKSTELIVDWLERSYNL